MSRVLIPSRVCLAPSMHRLPPRPHTQAGCRRGGNSNTFALTTATLGPVGHRRCVGSGIQDQQLLGGSRAALYSRARRQGRVCIHTGQGEDPGSVSAQEHPARATPFHKTPYTRPLTPPSLPPKRQEPRCPVCCLLLLPLALGSPWELRRPRWGPAPQGAAPVTPYRSQCHRPRWPHYSRC